MRTLNEYSMVKTAGVCVLSIIAMLLIGAIVVLLFALTSQLFSFFERFFMEVKMLYLE